MDEDVRHGLIREVALGNEILGQLTRQFKNPIHFSIKGRVTVITLNIQETKLLRLITLLCKSPYGIIQSHRSKVHFIHKLSRDFTTVEFQS